MSALDIGSALAAALKACNQGERAVIVTVVGSIVPEIVEAGARIVVCGNGWTLGSIHEQLDSVLHDEAVKAIHSSQSRTRSYHLATSTTVDVGVEGGDIDVYFEVLVPPPHLVIVGAGHIAVPLAKVAKLLDFAVTIVDDRPQYGNHERFPVADRVLLGPYRETVASIPMTPETSVVLVTRGHVHDQACLEEVLGSQAGYVGMIGSRRRVRTVFEHLRLEGADPSALDRVHAPIGLDIGSRTPAEIAVAIMAEIINVRNGGKAPSLALRTSPRD